MLNAISFSMNELSKEKKNDELSLFLTKDSSSSEKKVLNNNSFVK